MTMPDPTESSMRYNPLVPTASSASVNNVVKHDLESVVKPASNDFKNNHGNSMNSHRRTRSRSAPIAVDFPFFTEGNAQGLPNYMYTQHVSQNNSAPNYKFVQQPVITPSGYEYGEPLYTPTTSTTSNYQDPWYSTSYANTPLLGTENPQLESPMVPGLAHFDSPLNLTTIDAYRDFPSLASFPQPSLRTNPTQSLPELPRLDSVPEVPMTDPYSDVRLSQSIEAPPMEPMSVDFTQLASAAPCTHEENSLYMEH